jgi:hypothetical protein
MGGECSIHGKYEKCLPNFPGKAKRKRPLGRLGADGEIILDYILRK